MGIGFELGRRAASAVVVAVFVVALFVAVAAVVLAAPEAGAMTLHARGEFDVVLTPLEGELAAADPKLGRMRIEKSYRGELEGTALGEMLAALTAVEGSAGYVAIEHVSAALGGRTGTFVLQHSGTMERGAQSLAIRVVPDSGTGGLAGIAGSMSIRIEDGKHFYDLEYTLAEP
jgi:hypothetical protein